MPTKRTSRKPDIRGALRLYYKAVEDFRDWETKTLPWLENFETATTRLLDAGTKFPPELQNYLPMQGLRRQLFAMKDRARQLRKIHRTMRLKIDKTVAQFFGTQQDAVEIARLMRSQMKMLKDLNAQGAKLTGMMEKVTGKPAPRGRARPKPKV